MDVDTGSLVFSEAGRDRDGLFLVLEKQGEYCFIADGRGRRAEKPKKKKLKHLRSTGETAASLKSKIELGEKPTNTEIRNCIREFAEKTGYKL